MNDLSEYEAKRERRIEENREKLLALDLPIIQSPSCQFQDKKRKRNVNEKLQNPTRKSSRQCQRRQEKFSIKEEHQVIDRYDRQHTVKLERKERKRRSKTAQILEHETNEQICTQEEPPKSLDWRARRKMQAEMMRRQRREDEKKRKAVEIEQKKEQKARKKLEKFFLKEFEKQQRFEELELMKHEDFIVRELMKHEKKEEKKRLRIERDAARIVFRLLRKRLQKREMEMIEDEKFHQEMYPVRQIALPFVRISQPTIQNVRKPSAVLKIDTKLFHGFSLGKQFLPPGKQTVMQGLAPGGYTAIFQRYRDLQVWNNALTLFVNGTTGMFHRFMFEEAKLRDRKFVFFRWSRCEEVTPSILERLRQVPKGEEWLRFDNNYYDTPESSNSEPLLLFLQYPKGPYIYCGRLGYLGYRSNPLEFSFQLLDSNALNWKQLRTLITTA
ncbi:hypothetical protein Plhal304r1_c014g0051321 [Plasmopara halstedii]